MGTTTIQDRLARHRAELLELVDEWLDSYLDGKIDWPTCSRMLQGLRW